MDNIERRLFQLEKRIRQVEIKEAKRTNDMVNGVSEVQDAFLNAIAGEEEENGQG